jgi:Na+/H+ antiporter NhaC
MQNWIVVIPPLLVLGLAVLTHRVLFSLFIGIVASALIVTNWQITSTVLFILHNFWQQLYDASNLYTFAFLIILGMIISLMSAAGGTSAYGTIIKNILKSARSAKFSSIILSLLFMIDDFFSCLTVGCIMRPLTDSFKIPRAKLAFLIDSLAAPLVIIMPVSTWIAMLLMQLDKAGISDVIADKPIFNADPFLTYLQIIPYVFYSFIILTSVWFIIKYNISFGLMRTHEEIAQKTGNLFGGKEPQKTTITESPKCGSLFDFMYPLVSLIIISFLGFLYSHDAFFAFLVGSIFSCLTSLALMMARNKITTKQLKPVAIEGYELMIGSIQILFLAWTFSSILKNDLQTGQYIAHLLLGSLPGWFLPSMFFMASLITAIATGSSWGTIAVMIPIAVPMVATFFGVSTPASITSVPMLLPVLGAIFSGAVAGDHVSPIGTTTVMSATSAGAYLDDHVWTQLPYALPALIATIIAYIISGILVGYPWWISSTVSLASGIVISLGGLYLLNNTKNYFKSIT